jgi:hypothetical protein
MTSYKSMQMKKNSLIDNFNAMLTARDQKYDRGNMIPLFSNRIWLNSLSDQQKIRNISVISPF